jgi:hypothetical protein
LQRFWTLTKDDHDAVGAFGRIISNTPLIALLTHPAVLLTYLIHINTYEPKEWGLGMDIENLKKRIDASGKKLTTLGNEYIKSKDEISARKVLVKMLSEVSQQTLMIGEQNAQLDRNMKLKGLR